jgi:hypothetical protein
MKLTELKQIIKEEISKALNEESWAEFDAMMDAEDAKKEAMKQEFLNTPQGKNAMMVIGKLISKPYSYDKLENVLQVLNLDKTKFMYAADGAGMIYRRDGAGIHILDKNYKDKGVSIDYMNGEWYVG